MFCATCGATLESTATFCTNCGVVVAQPDSFDPSEIESQSPRQEVVEVMRKVSEPSTRSRFRLAVSAAAVVAALVTGAVVYTSGVIRRGSDESIAVVATVVAVGRQLISSPTMSCRVIWGT